MSTATVQIAGSIEHLDPNTLIIDDNIRTDVTLDKGFVDSVRENGVLSPVLGWRDDTGAVHVRAGQRRTLAAREATLASVPVYVVDSVDAQTAGRIIEQIVENDQRVTLNEADRVQAWKQLELEGLSATAIARRTGAKRDRVKTGLTVAASDIGTTLIVDAGLTLDQAAELIEFEGDAETIANLTEIAGTDPGYFPVALQRARNDRAAQRARADVEATAAAKGYRILTDRPGWNEMPYRLRMLTTADGQEVTADDVQGKEGVAVYVEVYYGGEARPEYFVDDPAALGFTVREDVQLTAPQSGPMTDEQKAERKTLIANNKEWDAAETVRREWIASFLSRKTLPKDAVTVLAGLLAAAGSPIGDALVHGSTMARSFLAIDEVGRGAFAEFVDAHPTHAVRVALAVALGGIEENTSRETWRHPPPDTPRYFRELHAWGYNLTPVEKIAAMITDE